MYLLNRIIRDVNQYIIIYFTIIIAVLFNTTPIYSSELSSDSIVCFISKTFIENTKKNPDNQALLDAYNNEKSLLHTDNSLIGISTFAINTGKILKDNECPQAAIKIFKSTIQYINTVPKKNQEVDYKLYELYNLVGIMLSNLGNDSQSLENYLLAFRIAQNLNWDVGLAKSYNNIGTLYLEQGNYVKAEELIKESMNINEKLDDKNDLQINYNNLASIYNNCNDYDKALAFYKKALLINDEKDYYKSCVLYSNISQTYKSKNQYDDAYKYMTMAMRLIDKTNNDALNVQVLLNMSEIKASLNNKSESLSLIKDAENIINTKHISGISANAYRQISDIYASWKNSDKAYEYMLKYVEINDSLYKIYNKEKLLEFFSLYEFEKLELKNKELLQASLIKELTIQKQEYLLTSIIVIVVISVLSFITILRKVRSEKEKKALIAKQRERMLIQEKLLFEKNIGDLKSELDLKNRQLISYTLNMAKGNEFHAEIIETLESLKESCSEKVVSSEISDVVRKIYRYGNDNSSEEFKLYFESVHPDFYKSIIQVYPTLTQNELKLCAFLKLGLSTKEIASLTFRQIRSVESSRNRLRKKLNLSPDENIQTHLSQF